MEVPMRSFRARGVEPFRSAEGKSGRTAGPARRTNRRGLGTNTHRLLAATICA